MTDAKQTVRVLIVEDSSADAELVVLEIERTGLSLIWKRVATAAELRRALAAESWDVVISDYSMQGFDAPAALEIVRAAVPDLPFIIVSGSIGEELAVRAMKAGAQDFFLKDRLERLGAAIEREVADARLRAERTEALERLRASEERLKALVGQAIVGIAQIDLEGRFTFANERFCEITGRTKSELDTTREQDIVHPDDLGSFERRLEAARAGQRTFAHEKRYVRKDGSHVWVYANAAVLLDLHDAPTAIVIVIEDITDRRRAERERERLFTDLQRTVKLSEMFAGVLGHDLRNPLMTITMGAALLLRDFKDSGDSKHAEVVSRIVRSGDRMRRMIDQLLDFTRMRLGSGIPLVPQHVDLGEIGRQVIDELTVGDESAVIELEVLGGAVGEWDRDRLLQLVSNLVANALDHRTPGTNVRVCVDGRADPVVLTVENDGAIKPSVLPLIFEPMQTTKQTKRDRASGLGLGLYITRQIARAHGATLSVDSSEGEGTRFTVALPRSVDVDTSGRRPSSFQVAAPPHEHDKIASTPSSETGEDDVLSI
jgi:phosphoserine phosphatase RsbU/P